MNPTSETPKNLKLVIMVGISGCGKDTYIENKFKHEHPNVKIFSSDDMRQTLTGDANNQACTPQVFSIIKRNADIELSKGNDVLINATNLNPKDRRSWVDIAKKHNATLIAYVMERDRDTLIARQKLRGASGGRVVPDSVIDRMLQKYIRPSRSEGFDETRLI